MFGVDRTEQGHLENPQQLARHSYRQLPVAVLAFLRSPHTLVWNNGSKSEDDLQSWYIIIIYTKISREFMLNRDLCGVFLDLQTKKTSNYWSMEQNKWKIIFRSPTVDIEMLICRAFVDGILFYTSTNFCWCREPLICRTLFGTLIFVSSSGWSVDMYNVHIICVC